MTVTQNVTTTFTSGLKRGTSLLNILFGGEWFLLDTKHMSLHDGGEGLSRAVHVHAVVLVWRGMAPRKKKTRVNVTTKWLSKHHDVRTRASLGGVRRFAKAHKLPLKKAQRILEQDLAYTLHKPRRRRFPTLPVIVGGLDDQWVVDLVEVQPLAKYNRGVRYLMTVVDALSKYAWVQPLKAKTGVAVVQAFDKILRQGRRPNRLQTDRGKEFYNRTFQQWAQKHGIHHFSRTGMPKRLW